MSGPASGSDPLEAISAMPRGTEIRLTLPSGEVWKGWLLPNDPLSGPRTISLKLGSGYNVGVLVPTDSKVEVMPGPRWGEAASSAPSPNPAQHPREETRGAVVILTTGGTIASRVDYTTGGVNPVHGRKAFESIHPDLAKAGPVVLREVFDILSEDVGPTHWVTLAEEIRRAFDEGARGVVITHGTDTMAYTASALAFQLRELPGPVVLVGAQRSIDRPSSDGVINLRGAVQVARDADLGEVVVVMHQGPSDTALSIHRGTRVRKMHSTRRDAFRSLNAPVLGALDGSLVLHPSHRSRSGGSLTLHTGFEPRTSLVWVHPGLTVEMLRAHTTGSRGVVLAGTGMGHTSSQLLAWAQQAVQSGMTVAMATQCLGGEVDPLVYSRGRELEAAGVAYLGDTLPETAFVKLAWILHRSKDPGEIQRLLQQNLAGERSDVRSLSGSHPE